MPPSKAMPEVALVSAIPEVAPAIVVPGETPVIAIPELALRSVCAARIGGPSYQKTRQCCPFQGPILQ
jgi:hypothetical protein